MKIRYSSQYRIQQCVLLASILLCVKMERKRRKPGGDYCSAFGCHNSRNNSDLSMFSFPKDEERLVCHFMLHLYHKIVVKPTVLATFHTKHKTSMSACISAYMHCSTIQLHPTVFHMPFQCILLKIIC